MEDMGKKIEETIPTVNIEELNIYFGESNSNYYGGLDPIISAEEDPAEDKEAAEEDPDKDDDSDTKEDSNSDFSDDVVEEFLNEIFGNQGSCCKAGKNPDYGKNHPNEEWIVKITRKNHEQGRKGDCHAEE